MSTMCTISQYDLMHVEEWTVELYINNPNAQSQVGLMQTSQTSIVVSAISQTLSFFQTTHGMYKIKLLRYTTLTVLNVSLQVVRV
jgi:hypothetical protein